VDYYYWTKTRYTMRMLFLLAGLLVFTTGFSPLLGQDLSRDEKKEWKKKAKQYKRNPAELKELVEEKERYEREVKELSSQVNELEAEKANRRSRIAQLEREVTRLQNSLAETQSALDRAQQAPQQPAPERRDQGDDMQGLVFKVQIGAYNEMQLSDGLDAENDNLDLETENGMQKIIIGKFRDFESADMLKAHMQKIGIPDAWVVAYQDGVRVPVESVVPGYGG